MVRARALLLLVACIPGRHPVVGSACDATHPCPDELACVAGVCSDGSGGAGGGGGGGSSGGGTGGGGATACANNLLTDGDFEQQLLTGVYWEGADFTVQGATVRSGAWAAKLSAGASARTVTLRTQRAAISPVSGADHCAEAWVRATGTTGPIGLQLARWFTGPDLSAEATVVADGTWQRVTQRYAYPAGQISLTVQVNAPLAAGGEAFVDDVCVSVCP